MNRISTCWSWKLNFWRGQQYVFLFDTVRIWTSCWLPLGTEFYLLDSRGRSAKQAFYLLLISRLIFFSISPNAIVGQEWQYVGKYLYYYYNYYYYHHFFRLKEWIHEVSWAYGCFQAHISHHFCVFPRLHPSIAIMYGDFVTLPYVLFTSGFKFDFLY